MLGRVPCRSLRSLSPRGRPLSAQASSELRKHWTFIPDFLSESEQNLLLTASLKKLNDAEGGLVRRRRRRYEASLPDDHPQRRSFLPDVYYQFEEGHHDRVIRRYREMHLRAWPAEEDFLGLGAVLERIHDMCPKGETQTHLLHLASDGEILPHVDNLEASGSWILGVSLGSARTLRLQHPDAKEKPVDVYLPPGSLYVQRDTLRYAWQHSILPASVSADDVLNRSPSVKQRQRLSVMIRDQLAPT